MKTSSFIFNWIDTILCSYIEASPTAKVYRTIVRTALEPAQLSLAMFYCFLHAVFIICHSVKWVPNVWELMAIRPMDKDMGTWPQWIGMTVLIVSHFSH